MNDLVVPATITLQELETALAETDPATVLIRKRLLRRVLWQRTPPQAHGLGLFTRRYHVIARDALLAIVSANELGVRGAAALPDSVILLARSNELILGPRPRDQVLRQYWRLLFHARVELALRERCREEGTGSVEFAERAARIGDTEFAEIVTVLVEENLLIDCHDAQEAYIQFVAQFQELRHFAPDLLTVYFPGLSGREDVARLVAGAVDAAPIFASTRLPGAQLPNDAAAPGTSAAPAVAAAAPLSAHRRFQLRRWVRRAERRGNNLRAALIQVQLAQAGTEEQQRIVLAEASDQLHKLSRRLAAAVTLDDVDEQAWYSALTPLLTPAAQGYWPAEARLLYDLQHVCLDRERPLKSVSVLRWLVSLGRQPMTKLVPGQQLVLMLKHLRAARSRLQTVHLADEDCQRLERLLDAALRRQAVETRDYFRPILHAALAAVALVPHHLPESTARDKLIEELLDRIVERGLVTMGDARDAVSRNQLKLDDLSTADEFVLGDKLLQLNSELGQRLDNVYRPGEFYLRWMQSLSALAFGTAAGRWLTRFLILPFGGAFVILKFLFFMYLEVLHLLPKPPEPVPEPVEIYLFDPDAEWWELLDDDPHHQEAKAQLLWDPLTTPWTLVGLGVFLFLSLHSPPFRRALIGGIRATGRWLRWLMAELPSGLLNLPAIQSLRRHPAYRAFKRYLLKPLVPAALAFLVAFLCRATLEFAGVVGAVAYAGAAIYLGSRAGRMTDEILSNWILEGAHNVSYQIVPTLLRAILDLFKRLVAEVERVLYGVDEWFRFRRGENLLARGLKSFFGLFWLGVSYIVRLAVVLIIEPTVNPIKHFPVVTVAGKFMLLLLPILPSILSQFMGRWLAGLVTSIIVFGLPGIFGFLVWELKENWRLYRANRPRTLRPVMVGHHGETVGQLLRPGFHSGTIPKTFARWRAAVERERGRAAAKAERRLDQTEEAVRHFVERELMVLLTQVGLPHCQGLSLRCVHLSVNRIRFEVNNGHYPSRPLVIALEWSARRLQSRFVERGWLELVPEVERDTVTHALRGLLCYAGMASPGEEHQTIAWEDWVVYWDRAQADWSAASGAKPVCYNTLLNTTSR